MFIFNLYIIYILCAHWSFDRGYNYKRNLHIASGLQSYDVSGLAWMRGVDWPRANHGGSILKAN